jgi:isoleucyl-tRNA synthetase
MEKAQRVCSLVLSLRKKEKIKVRQPLQKVLIPALTDKMREELVNVSDIIKSEVNVKEIEFLAADNQLLVKKVKPNFKSLGKQLGPHMKKAAELISAFGTIEIAELEKNGEVAIDLPELANVKINIADVEISAQDMPGWLVANEGDITVALDIHISEPLLQEGIARELVNRIQNIRKESDFEVTDKISVQYKADEHVVNSIVAFYDYICKEVLAIKIEFNDNCSSHPTDVYETEVFINIEKA